MYLSWPIIVFYYLFDILLLLLFLFAESYLDIYVLGGIALLFLAYSSKLDLSRFFDHKVEFLLGTLFFIGLLIASYFTHAPVLSLSNLIFFGFALTFFSFFLLLDKKYLQTELLFSNLLVVIFPLSLLSLLFSVFPNLPESLPEMNLIYATYGHSHFGTVAIMFLPIVWYFIFLYRQERKKQLPFLGLMFLLMVNLALSFSRLAMIIGFLQFAFFAGRYVFLKDINNFYIKAVAIFLSFLAIFALVFVNYYSVAKLLGLEALCPLPNMKDKICKDVVNEQRPQYFKTALAATKDNFWFGYGPGSYVLVNEKYKTRPDVGTRFAHNFILQLSAESGLIVTIIFLFWIGFFLLKAVKLSFFDKGHREFSIKGFLFLGIISLLGISLLDFDLSYLSLFSLMLLFFSQIFISAKSRPKSATMVKLLKFIFNLSFISFILLSVLSLIIEYFLISGQVNRAARFFPYFQSHMKIFLDEYKNLDQISRQKLDHIYTNYLYRYTYADEVSGYIENKEKITEISPWTVYSPTILRGLAEKNEELASREVENLFNRYKKLSDRGYRGAPYIDYEIAFFTLSLADKYLSEGKLELAANYYTMASGFFDWVFVSNFPRFLYHFENEDQKIEFWSKMTGIKSEYFAQHSTQVASDHRILLIDSLNKNDISGAKKWLQRIVELESGIEVEMGRLELPLAQKMADFYVESEDWQNAEEAIKLVYEFNSWEGMVQLGNFYLMKGQIDLAKSAYQTCLNDWRYSVHIECKRMLESDLVKSNEPYLSFARTIRAKN